MAKMTATEAKNRFGQLLELAQAEPVFVQKDGRDVAVMLSAEQYRQLSESAAKPKVRPAVEQLLAESIKRRKSLYETLAK